LKTCIIEQYSNKHVLHDTRPSHILNTSWHMFNTRPTDTHRRREVTRCFSYVFFIITTVNRTRHYTIIPDYCNKKDLQNVLVNVPTWITLWDGSVPWSRLTYRTWPDTTGVISDTVLDICLLFTLTYLVGTEMWLWRWGDGWGRGGGTPTPVPFEYVLQPPKMLGGCITILEA